MSGHKGYGATSSPGRLPRPRFHLGIPAIGDEARLAIQVRKSATEIGISCAETLTAMRKDGVVECDDDFANAVLWLCGGLKL